MTDLPVCKLCGAAPIEIQTFECMKHMCQNRKCTLNNVLFTPDQWIALMGEDRDALRYRWLRDRNNDQHDPFAENLAAKHYGMEWDAAIDAAMKEQGNG